MLQIWHTTDDASCQEENKQLLCMLKMNIHTKGSWKVSLYFSAPFHNSGCAWIRKCVLTLSWSWPGVEGHHREIKNHIPLPLRKTEILYESCSPLQQQSPRYSLLHLDIHMEIQGFLSSRSSLLNCLHMYGWILGKTRGEKCLSLTEKIQKCKLQENYFNFAFKLKDLKKMSWGGKKTAWQFFQAKIISQTTAATVCAL